MEAFPDSERRQERRFNRKGVAMNIHCEVAKRLTEMIHHSYDQLQQHEPFHSTEPNLQSRERSLNIKIN
jgi:hypothetical protein